MSRRYHPNRRRRRPGRPPPHRYQPRPQPGGFTGQSLDVLYGTLMPNRRGSEMKAFFNQTSLVITLTTAYGAAVVGYGMGGLFGAILGAVLGLTGGCRLAQKGRFFRK